MRIAGLMQEKPQEKSEALKPYIIPLRIKLVQHSDQLGSDLHLGLNPRQTNLIKT